jgi:hypothetical protein
MLARLNNRLTYLSISFVLLLAAVPLISIGTNRGIPLLWWLGLGALVLGGLIPPTQRLLNRTPPSP